MDTVTTPATRSYEVAAQREMIEMALENGVLRGELKIARCTLNSLLPHMEGDWRKNELNVVIARIDLALETKT